MSETTKIKNTEEFQSSAIAFTPYHDPLPHTCHDPASDVSRSRPIRVTIGIMPRIEIECDKADGNRCFILRAHMVRSYETGREYRGKIIYEKVVLKLS